MNNTAGDHRPFDPGVGVLLAVGGVCALMTASALVFDIVLSTIPGWETTTTPETAVMWLEQAAANPWLAARNLDLLNAAVAILSLPLYLAVFAVQRRESPALSGLAIVLVLIGTAVFASNNVALPMLELGRAYESAAGLAERAVLVPAAAALVARGAHGTLGALPGFLLSSVGTLLIALSMLRSGMFSQRVAVMGVVGATTITLYVLVMTLLAVPDELVLTIAAPGGVLMIAWNVAVGWRLLHLPRGHAVTHASANRSGPVVRARGTRPFEHRVS